MSPEDRQSLEAFRRAATELRHSSIVANGREIEIEHRARAGAVDVLVRLHPPEPFRSLALAVRLVYAQREPAQFGRICNILRVNGPTEIASRVALARERWNATLNSEDSKTSVGSGSTQLSVPEREVFEHWMNGVAFHQDADRQPMVRLLEAEGAMFSWAVQAFTKDLALQALDLDDIVADMLREPRLPRVGATEDLSNG